MITLNKKKHHEFGEELESKLKSLVIAFKTEEIDENSDDELFIVDGGKKISGKEELEMWLRQLESELRWTRSLSGDACFIDPNSGKTC